MQIQGYVRNAIFATFLITVVYKLYRMIKYGGSRMESESESNSDDEQESVEDCD
jgi:hypothetical protein